MSNEISVANKTSAIDSWNRDQIDLVKRMYCEGASDDELKLFEYVCRKSGLDPFIKQIYAIMRHNKKDNTHKMTIQTAIDGLRLIADRTGNYLPGKESTFVYDKNGNLYSATSYIKKRTSDGLWHEISASAILSEYKPVYANEFWNSKSHIMLAKCAEALALRKAFPAEMCGLYTKEELEQDIEAVPVPPKPSVKTSSEKKIVEFISKQQADELRFLIDLCHPDFKSAVLNYYNKQGIKSFDHLPVSAFAGLHKDLNQASLKHQQSNKESVDVS